MLDLVDLEQFDIKNQSSVGWDCACTTSSVALFGWNREFTLTTDLHSYEAFFPALNHLSAAHDEAKWFISVQ